MNLGDGVNPAHLVVVSSVEGSQVELRAGDSIPQTQVGGGHCLEPWDRVVVGLGPDLQA